MEGGPLLQDWWVEIAKEFIPYVNITAQLPDKPDQNMLQEKGGRGFPYCIFMDSHGKVLDEVRPSDRESFRTGMKPIALLLSARKAVKDAEKSRDKKLAKQNLALIEAVFEPNERQFRELNKLAKKKKLDEEIRELYVAMVETWPIRKAVEAMQEGMRGAGPDPEKRRQVETVFEEKMYRAYRDKLRVEKESQPYFDEFWIGVAKHSIAAKDKKTGLMAIEKLEKKYSGNDGALRYFGGIRRDLEEL